jgi:hypothetical protein
VLLDDTVFDNIARNTILLLRFSDQGLAAMIAARAASSKPKRRGRSTKTRRATELD